MQKLYVHLAGGLSNGVGTCVYADVALWITGDGAGNAGHYVLPVRLPHGAAIQELSAIFHPDLDPLTVELRRVVPSLPMPVATVIKTISAAAGSAAAAYTVTLTPAHTVNNVDAWYELHIFSGTQLGIAYVLAVALTVAGTGIKNTEPL